MLNSWTLRLTVLLLVVLLLFASSRNERFTTPVPADMEEKRREWDTNYAAMLGPPAPMHEVPAACIEPCCHENPFCRPSTAY